MPRSPVLIDLPVQYLSDQPMIGPSNWDNFFESTKPKSSFGTCRSSTPDLSSSKLLSGCSQIDLTDLITFTKQTVNNCGKLAHKPAGPTNGDSSQYELFPRSLTSQVSSPSEYSIKPSFQSSTADKIKPPENVSSSQIEPQTYQSSSQVEPQTYQSSSQIEPQTYQSSSLLSSSTKRTDNAGVRSVIPTTSQGFALFTSTTETPGGNDKRNDRTRPSALRKHWTGIAQTKTMEKRVRWADSIQEDIAYTVCKKYLLDLSIPDDYLASAAVEAVTFMCDSEEAVSESLVDTAVKLFVLRYNRYPSSSELWLSVSDNNFDEKYLVLSFIKECKANKENDALALQIVNACLTTID